MSDDTSWQPIMSAPTGVWVQVKNVIGHPLMCDDGSDWWEVSGTLPPPPIAIAIKARPSEFGLLNPPEADEFEWRVFSADGGIYGVIAEPTHWRRLSAD